MKNNLLIVIFCCYFTAYVNATPKDSIQSLDIIDVQLDRGVDSLNIVKLVIYNLLDDSINIHSKFFIDEYYKASRILIYRCEYSNEKDSVTCNWGYFQGILEPTILDFSSARGIYIPPKGKISLEIPLRSPYFDKCEIFLDVRILCIFNETAEFISKTTNKIYFEKVDSILEKYQNEKNNGNDKK